MAGRLRSPPLPAGGRGVRVPRRKLRGCALSGTTDRRERGRREGVFAPNGRRGWTRGRGHICRTPCGRRPPTPTPRGGARRFRVTNTSISSLRRRRAVKTHRYSPNRPLARLGYLRNPLHPASQQGEPGLGKSEGAPSRVNVWLLPLPTWRGAPIGKKVASGSGGRQQ